MVDAECYHVALIGQLRQKQLHLDQNWSNLVSHRTAWTSGMHITFTLCESQM